MLAQREKRSIPEGWAIDSAGNSTTDPAAALQGALLPVGGPKGSGLAIFVDILAGALSGSSVGTGVKGTFAMNSKGTKGDFFLAIDPEFFAGSDLFLDRVGDLANQVASARPAPGRDSVLVPGALERQHREQRFAAGVDLDDALFEELQNLAADR